MPTHGKIHQRRPFQLHHADFTTDTGANASAEEAEDALEDADLKVNNIVNSFRLQATSFDKKGYLTYLKGKICSRYALPRSN